MELCTDETGETSSRPLMLTKAPSRAQQVTEGSPRVQELTSSRPLMLSELDLADLSIHPD